jgi:hypothetical protein
MGRVVRTYTLAAGVGALAIVSMNTVSLAQLAEGYGPRIPPRHYYHYGYYGPGYGYWGFHGGPYRYGYGYHASRHRQVRTSAD